MYDGSVFVCMGDGTALSFTCVVGRVTAGAADVCPLVGASEAFDGFDGFDGAVCVGCDVCAWAFREVKLPATTRAQAEASRRWRVWKALDIRVFRQWRHRRTLRRPGNARL